MTAAETASKPASPPAPSVSAVATDEVTVGVRSGARLIATVHRGAGGVTVVGDGGPSLTCSAVGGARDCRTGDGTIVATVTDEGASADRNIRVSAADGSLRWRVRVQPGKITLGAGDKGGGDWTITRLRSAQARAQVTDPHGKVVGSVKGGSGRAPATVEDVTSHKRFTVEGAPGSLIGALLLISTLAAPDRLLLMGALFAHDL